MAHLSLRRSVFLLLAAAPAALAADYSFYALMAVTKEYVVGAKLPPSGLFLRRESDWHHAAYNHPFLFGFDSDPADPSTLYLAAGNGLFRAARHGEEWTLLTGSDVTELRDVSVAPDGTIYFAYSHGIRVSRDRGMTWREISGGLRRKFTEALRVDRTKPDTLLAGGEEGIFRSGDGGLTWQLAGAAGIQITRIEQSPLNACLWLATTYEAGLYGSTDCGRSFESTGRLGVGRNLYDVAFHPSDPARIAVAGWGPGVAISEDSGKTWQFRNKGLPTAEVTAVAFDPAHPGRIYAGIHQEALFVSDDLGQSWHRDGLDGSSITRLKFVPAGGRTQ